MWERFVERTLEHVSPWAWVAAGAALLLSWQPARKGLRSLAVTGVKNGIIIGDRLGDLKANWRQAWQDIVAEARNVRNVTEDIKTAATNIKEAAGEVKEFIADD
ncbi:hypothetical protein [Neomoorella thermoacetica]|uniref:Uncharacterized protein n=1 Tax=Neomoorella thermoacetica TaxID=1525 RepID=A0A5D3I5G0_NEOTH|nr:hypothetical protein [Moorella thermoacetica]AOQ22888.1 hypothetical protein Maut_00413 [Moorella thermoacetica]APC07556.1 hypothetical protein MTJW_03760 [Moorella thermoacetica]OIQ11665.1 hypothetical protein MOOTH_14520 [Moorella thermoacetica]TYL09972.1 hypothetical protein MTAT_24680 [Moorella thermoacetica]